MKRTLLLALTILSFSCIQAQDQYEIKIKVDGFKDTIANMSYYFGKGQYYKDTAQVNSNGEFVFSKPQYLDEGMYSVLIGQTKLFDFMVDVQKLSFSTTKDAPITDMKIKGGEENQLFYEYLVFLNEKQIKATEAREKKKNNPKVSKEHKEADELIEKLDAEVKEFLTGFYKKSEGTFTYSFLKALESPEVPEAPLLENGQPDSTFPFTYFRDHFFDNLDFSDDRLVRTSAYHEKITYYIDKLRSQAPDSIIKSCDFILNKVKDSPELYKYTLNTFTSKYERSKMMGMDAVFVHLAKNYFMAGKADWMTDQQMAKLSERAHALDPLLIGKKAPNIIVKDTSQKRELSLYNIKSKYTVVYIWSPTCGHCKVATPELKEMYDRMKDRGVEIFGIGSEYENEEWIEFINKHDLNWINGSDGNGFKSNFRSTYDVYSTPQTYLLDENKIILSKKMNVESLEEILEYFMSQDQKDEND
jgi:peroxiredoxin